MPKSYIDRPLYTGNLKAARKEADYAARHTGISHSVFKTDKGHHFVDQTRSAKQHVKNKTSITEMGKASSIAHTAWATRKQRYGESGRKAGSLGAAVSHLKR